MTDTARMRRRTATATTTREETHRGQQVVPPEGQTTAWPVPLPDGPHAIVVVEGGATINLGNYQSAKVGVTVHLPCPPTKDGIEAAYQAASEWVDEHIAMEIEKATEGDA